MIIKATSFETDQDVIDYLIALVNSGYNYHLDDNPRDIKWALPTSEEQADILQKNHNKLWDYLNRNSELDVWTILQTITACIDPIPETIQPQADLRLDHYITAILSSSGSNLVFADLQSQQNYLKEVVTLAKAAIQVADTH
jgi:hypothetical protein